MDDRSMGAFETYEWTDEDARRIFEDIKQTVNGIWRNAASEARDQPPDRIAEIRREAFKSARPYLDDANALRKVHARPKSSNDAAAQK